MNTEFSLLGPLAWPLAACSALTLILILERLVYFSLLARLMATRLRFLDHDMQAQRWDAVAERLSHWRGIPAKSVQLLFAHRSQPHSAREEIIRLWFDQQRRRLFAYLRWLLVLAIGSLLLGLLGTVLGLFETLLNSTNHTNPINAVAPAPGMHKAMLALIVGLVIAIPALIARQAFCFWTQAYLTLLERLLSHINLSLEDLSGGSVNNPATVYSGGATNQ